MASEALDIVPLIDLINNNGVEWEKNENSQPNARTCDAS